MATTGRGEPRIWVHPCHVHRRFRCGSGHFPEEKASLQAWFTARIHLLLIHLKCIKWLYSAPIHELHACKRSAAMHPWTLSWSFDDELMWQDQKHRLFPSKGHASVQQHNGLTSLGPLQVKFTKVPTEGHCTASSPGHGWTSEIAGASMPCMTWAVQGQDLAKSGFFGQHIAPCSQHIAQEVCGPKWSKWASLSHPKNIQTARLTLGLFAFPACQADNRHCQLQCARSFFPKTKCSAASPGHTST